MDDKLLIASRVARELRPGTLVNLGIGLPTLVAGLVPADAHIFFQSENGIIGMQSIPEHGLEDDDLTDAGMQRHHRGERRGEPRQFVGECDRWQQGLSGRLTAECGEARHRLGDGGEARSR